MHEAKALATGYFRDRHSVLAVAEGIGECIALASMPLDLRPKPISTGIPSLDLDRRGGVIPGKGEHLGAGLLRHVRDRWSIENSWHWVRDTQLREDSHRYREVNGVQILATLRTMGLNALRLDGKHS